MSIPIDNSTQLPQTAFTSGPPDFANVNEWSKIGSNIYNTSLGNIGIGTTNTNGYKLNISGSLNSSSLYQNGTQIDFSSYATNTALTNGLAAKQNNLTALTNLVGIGSAITELDYNKITLNKPTTFPAIMTDIYNKTETNNLLNAKQNTLTAATTLLGTGGSITGINFNTITNKPTYTSPLSSNVSTNVISVDLSSYATNTALTNGLAAKQNTLTAATTLLGTGGSITGINFNTITNKPTYTSPLSSNVSTNVISVDLSSKQNTLTASTVLAGIGSNLTLINYATLSNLPTSFPANMTDIYTKTETNNLLNAKEAILTFSSPIIRTVNTISLNQSLIDFNNLLNKPDMNLYLLKSGGAMTGNLTTTGNIGIGTNTPQRLFHIRGANPTYLRIETSNSLANETTGIEFGINGYAAGSYARITSTTSANFTNDIQFLTSSGENTSSAKMTILGNGNIGIGTTDPQTLLHVNGNLIASGTGISSIANGINITGATNQPQSLFFRGLGYNLGIAGAAGNYSSSAAVNDMILRTIANTKLILQSGSGASALIIDGSNNTTLNGSLSFKTDIWNTSTDGIYRFYFAPNNTTYICSGGAAGDNGLVVYGSAAAGYSNNLVITNSGNATIRGNIDCGGGLAITGSTAFFGDAAVNTGNKTNTYINFKFAGSDNDWCYLRQIGSPNAYKLAFDFHDDDNDARFCIRRIHSAGQDPDIISEVFTIDNGNIIASGSGTSSIANGLNISGATTQSQSLFFRSDVYNLGVAGGAGAYSSSAAANDMILRTAPNTKLILQSGSGAGALIIDGSNNTTLNGSLSFKTNVWNKSNDNQERFYFASGGRTYFRGIGTPTASDNAFEFFNNAFQAIFTLNDNGRAFFVNEISCKFNIAPANPHDYIGVASNDSPAGAYTMYIIQGSFTGFHRSIMNDELFNIEEPQQFKDDYVGRIVISTGKIATDINKGTDDWQLHYDKEGIFIEDSHPIIELCRKKKDKRVFGVLGDPRRKISRTERMIVNGIGEGGLWVCNSNGNIENGDYINSSDFLGYGEKQDDDLLHNYTVAKALINCDFELDSPYYECKEIEDGLRVAFIAVSYHCS